MTNMWLRCVPTEQFVRIKFHGVFNIRIIRIINWVVESAKNKTHQTKKETKQNKQSKTKPKQNQNMTELSTKSLNYSRRFCCIS